MPNNIDASVIACSCKDLLTCCNSRLATSSSHVAEPAIKSFKLPPVLSVPPGRPTHAHKQSPNKPLSVYRLRPPCCNQDRESTLYTRGSLHTQLLTVATTPSSTANHGPHCRQQQLPEIVCPHTATSLSQRPLPIPRHDHGTLMMQRPLRPPHNVVRMTSPSPQSPPRSPVAAHAGAKPPPSIASAATALARCPEKVPATACLHTARSPLHWLPLSWDVHRILPP